MNETSTSFANIPLQPNLENELVKIRPLKPEDFEILYKIASDPLVWEQHPNKNRYQKEIFKTFFTGAIESKGAFLVFNTKTNEAIGSSRFYDFDTEKKSILIGYTFLARECWGKGFNKALKSLMLTHAFNYADKVIFHVGSNNIRSQKAMEKLGMNKVGEEEIAYYGEQNNLNYVYQIDSKDWSNLRK